MLYLLGKNILAYEMLIRKLFKRTENDPPAGG